MLGMLLLISLGQMSYPGGRRGRISNPAILEYLTQSKFWPTCIPVHAYERRKRAML